MKIPATAARPRTIPEASLRRLPIYYRFLQKMVIDGVVRVSCADLARGLGLDPTQVRKDIEMTGIVGKPRFGYPLVDLVRWIENFLGWNRPKGAVLVGAGSLGSALLGYEKFRIHGMELVAAFDIDSGKIGQRIHGKEVQPLMFLPDFVRRSQILLGLIATPAEAAQSVADLMVAAGDSGHLELRAGPRSGSGAGHSAERGPVPLSRLSLIQAGKPDGSAALRK
jgi:redox-sensing transcriptional repressor